MGKWLCPLISARGHFPTYFRFLVKAPLPCHEPERWQMAEARTKGRRGEAGKGSRESQTQGLAGPGSTEKLAVKDDPGAGEESENTQTPEVPLAEPRSGLQNWPRRAQKPGDVPSARKPCLCLRVSGQGSHAGRRPASSPPQKGHVCTCQGHGAELGRTARPSVLVLLAPGLPVRPELLLVWAGPRPLPPPVD